MSKYQEFDNALMVQIRAGRNTMTLLDGKSSGLHDLAQPHRAEDPWGNKTPEFRIIDRRLQALRKQGLIRFNGKAWEEVAQ